MPYVTRDPGTAAIVALWGCPPSGNHETSEFLNDDHPAVVAFKNPVEKRRRAVDAERDRRCEGDDAEMLHDGIVYQVRTKDMRNITGAGAAAIGAIMQGKQPGDLRWHVQPHQIGTSEDKDFEWIAKDDSKVPMDAPATLAFSMAALARVSKYVFVANAIKALLDTQDEPADITDNALWP